MDKFTEAFLVALLWSSGDEFDNFSIYDFNEDDLKRLKKDCKDFKHETYYAIYENLEKAGHDFALTRNGHGAGFWDGEWLGYGDELTKISESFKEINLYVGDDKKLYIY